MTSKPAAEPPLVLGSRSKARRELLGRLGIPFECQSSSCDERALEASLSSGQRSDPVQLALALALGKSEGLRPSASQWTLAADQIAWFQRHALHKVSDEPSAVERLMMLSGKEHELVNAMVLRKSENRVLTCTTRHRLRMRPFGRSEAQRYVRAARTWDSCGAYHVEDAGVLLFETIDIKEPGAIEGLPLLSLGKMLRTAGLIV